VPFEFVTFSSHNRTGERFMSDIAPNPHASVSTDGPQCPYRPVLERIESRESVLGEGLVIRRALPSRGRRMVGAWCFLDHAGPMVYGAGGGIAVGPHPHIGLQTFSWMMDGEIMHRDSLGNEQVIRPGQVNLMTAGRGITHSEDAVNDSPGRIHLAQLWIALPDHARHMDPAFEHHPVLPVVPLDGFDVTVLAGSALGRTSPATVYTPLVGLDVRAEGPAHTSLPLELAFEHAALVLEGAASVEGEALTPGTLLYLGTGRSSLELAAAGPARLLVIGGEPFAEEVLLFWNFVARTADEIETATADWNAGRRFARDIGSPTRPHDAPPLDAIRLKARKP
jgi:quercetin 2,3-dioxygenase